MSTGELFISLLCEEIPASMVRPALDGLRDGLLGLLSGVTHGEVRVWSTPRRFAVAIADVAEGRPFVESVVTGPPADRAFDAEGNPSKSAIGFAASKGLPPSALHIVELPKRGKVAAVTVREGGERTVDLIRDGLAGVIEAVPFKKAMVWGEGGLTFGRPLHGIVALYGGQVIEGQAHGIAMSNVTQGHRLFREPFTVTGADDWVAKMRAHKVEPDLDARKARIAALLTEAATTLGADPIDEPALLEEVTHLVEWPVSVLGAFDEDLLQLPPRLLITAMKVHQRYFPVHAKGALTHRFVVISNNPVGDADTIAEGNARVLRARFYDARFFFAEDKTTTLQAHGASLAKMRWIRGLGTMADKQQRVAKGAASLAAWCGADPAVAERAGGLCKSDLTTQMVGEFPELQGHVGRLYAAAQGEDAAVAEAIEAHWFPRSASDGVALSPTGAAVALADRFDTLVGCFGIGLEPKGGDPQGLRRAALGVVRTVLHHGLRGGLRSRIAPVVEAFGAFAAAAPEGFETWNKAMGNASLAQRTALVDALVAFCIARFKASKVAEGISPDMVDAVLDASGGEDDLVVLDAKLAALADVAASGDFPDILQTFKRVLNIAGDAQVGEPDPSAITEQVERDLLEATRAVTARVSASAEALDYRGALEAMLSLQAPVEAFFEGVMVQADDPSVRALRLGILLAVADVFRRVADFSRVSTR